MGFAGLTGFEREFKAVPGRQFRWDFTWPEDNLLIEVQGGTFARGKMGHSTGMGQNRDFEEQNLATLAGWRVMKFDDKQIRTGQALHWVQEFFRGVA